MREPGKSYPTFVQLVDSPIVPYPQPPGRLPPFQGTNVEARSAAPRVVQKQNEGVDEARLNLARQPSELPFRARLEKDFGQRLEFQAASDFGQRDTGFLVETPIVFPPKLGRRDLLHQFVQYIVVSGIAYLVRLQLPQSVRANGYCGCR